MQVVEAVVRLGSFAEAARELSLTESAISNAVRRLEHDLDVRLFERRGGRIQPRRSAIKIAAAASKACVLLRSALDGLSSDPADERVTLAATPTFATRWLASRLTDMEALVAPTKITVSSRVAFSDDADLWIRHAKVGRWPDLKAKRLLPDMKVPVASRSLIGKGGLLDRDVTRYPLIGVYARPNEWQEWSQAAGLDDAPLTQLTFDVTSNAWDAAVSGSGVALGNPMLLDAELTSGGLVRLGTTHLESHAYFLCRRRGDSRSTILRLWDWFCAELG
jgi:LysR family glycine cleavage system transcriptional activator